MIITKEVEININVSNIKYFENLGYDNLKIKQSIIVPVEKLMKRSHAIIKVKCDRCGDEYNIIFNSYKNPYHCKRCCFVKMKQTKFEKYGNENYVNPEKMVKTKLEKYGTLDMSEKIKETVRKNYGVDNVFQLEDVKNKIKKTNLIKYNVEFITQNNEIKNKIRKTFDDKYGGNLMGSEIIKKKIKETNLKKYGFEFSSQNDDVKKKKMEIFQNKYGGFLMGSKSTKQKIEKTNLEKYGHMNYFSTDEFKKSQGIILDKNLLNDWILYKRQSRRIFRKIKSKVIENWNGYDYYDNKYIKNNLNLPFYHKNYPTIDHKKSVYNGFINETPVEEINKIENLVVTTRLNNSIKGK